MKVYETINQIRDRIPVCQVIEENFEGNEILSLLKVERFDKKFRSKDGYGFMLSTPIGNIIVFVRHDDEIYVWEPEALKMYEPSVAYPYFYLLEKFQQGQVQEAFIAGVGILVRQQKNSGQSRQALERMLQTSMDALV